MNNDSTPTDLSRTDVNTSASANASGDVAEPAHQNQPSTQNATSLAQKRVLLRMKKRHEFVSNLMTNLDILIYAELSIVYYMEYATLSTIPSSLTHTLIAVRFSDFSFEYSTRCCS